MLVLLSCAKTMSAVSKVKVPLTTIPRFQKEAAEIALQMSQFSVDELERLLRVNAKIAVENYKRYQAFHAETEFYEHKQYRNHHRKHKRIFVGRDCHEDILGALGTK